MQLYHPFYSTPLYLRWTHIHIAWASVSFICHMHLSLGRLTGRRGPVFQMGSQMKKRFLTSRQPRPWRSGTRQLWRRSQQGVIGWPFRGPKCRHTSRRDGGERVAGTVNANYTTGLAFDLPGQCEEAKVIGDGDKDYGFLEWTPYLRMNPSFWPHRRIASSCPLWVASRTHL